MNYQLIPSHFSGFGFFRTTFFELILFSSVLRFFFYSIQYTLHVLVTELSCIYIKQTNKYVSLYISKHDLKLKETETEM